LVVTPLPVEPEHRDAILVLHNRIDLAVALVVGNHLAASGHVDRRAGVAAVVFLESFSIAATRRVALDAAHESVTRRAREAPAVLDVISAREIELLVVDPPRCVNVQAADAVLVVWYV